MPSRFARKVTVLSRVSGPRFCCSAFWVAIAGPDAVTKVAGTDVTVLAELDAMTNALLGLACLGHHDPKHSLSPHLICLCPDYSAPAKRLSQGTTQSLCAGVCIVRLHGWHFLRPSAIKPRSRQLAVMWRDDDIRNARCTSEQLEL